MGGGDATVSPSDRNSRGGGGGEGVWRGWLLDPPGGLLRALSALLTVAVKSMAPYRSEVRLFWLQRDATGFAWTGFTIKTDTQLLTMN